MALTLLSAKFFSLLKVNIQRMGKYGFSAPKGRRKASASTTTTQETQDNMY